MCEQGQIKMNDIGNIIRTRKAIDISTVPGDVGTIKAQASKNKLFGETGTDTQLTIANGVNEIKQLMELEK